jgi:molecular chaperone GrpE
MSKKKQEENIESQAEEPVVDEQQNVAQEEQPEEQPEENLEDEPEKEPTPEEIIVGLQAELEEEKKKYLFLMADFDNYRKRTLQEKQDLVKNGGQKVLEGILPVVDDIERAIDAIAQGGDIDSLKEGVDLIHNKLLSYLKSNNVEPIESTGELFDTDVHEAVTTFPAPSEDQKGKVIDTVLKGYTLNDKVLRHAKVVVGQ